MTSPEDIDIKAVMHAADRAADFAVSKLDGAGRLEGASDSVFAYFKALVSLASAGRFDSAGRVHAWMLQNFAKAGDYRSAGGGSPYSRLHLYKNAWIAAGHAALNRPQDALPTVRLLEQHFSGEHHGLFELPENPEQRRFMDLGSTCAAIQAFLHCRRTDLALRAGSFVRRLLDQPAADGRFCLRMSGDGQLLRQVPEGDSFYSFIEIGAPAQAYWYLGFSMRVCEMLYACTGDSEWIRVAYRAFSLLERCGEPLYESITNSKVGWGASFMFLSTGDERFRRMTVRILRWLLSHQTKEGTWLRPPSASFAEQAADASLEIAFERALTLRQMAFALVAGHRSHDF